VAAGRHYLDPAMKNRVGIARYAVLQGRLQQT
jgi:hypothetical protein